MAATVALLLLFLDGPLRVGEDFFGDGLGDDVVVVDFHAVAALARRVLVDGVLGAGRLAAFAIEDAAKGFAVGARSTLGKKTLRLHGGSLALFG
jgi:hypothetical protein